MLIALWVYLPVVRCGINNSTPFSKFNSTLNCSSHILLWMYLWSYRNIYNRYTSYLSSLSRQMWTRGRKRMPELFLKSLNIRFQLEMRWIAFRPLSHIRKGFSAAFLYFMKFMLIRRSNHFNCTVCGCLLFTIIYIQIKWNEPKFITITAKKKRQNQ